MGTIRDDLRDRASRFPDRPAVRVDGGGELTFGEWERRANALAHGLRSRGVRCGDRVALLLDNAAAVDFHVAYVGVQRAGAAVVPVNPRYAAREVEHVLADSRPTVQVTAVSDLLDPDESPADEPVDDDDLAEVLYTSGTTGLPKGVASTFGNQLAFDLPAQDSGGRLLHSIPLSTFTGVHGALATPMRLALTSVVQPRFDPKRFAELIEVEQPASVLMVPAQIALLLDSGELDRRDVSSVRMVMFGGAPSPPARIAALAQAFPGALLMNGYGLTEAGASACVLPAEEATRRPGSVGKPLPGVEVAVVDPDGRPLRTGEVGEILLRVQVGRRSYWGDAAATAQTWQDGWVHTGDLGRFDDDGFLYVVDRLKDMIIRGGYNIYCVEVENALGDHPDVLEAGVIGLPHRVLGEDICAVIRQRPGTPRLDVPTLKEFLADRLADYKRPRHVVVTDEPLPRNAMHKLDKLALRGFVDQLKAR